MSLLDTAGIVIQGYEYFMGEMDPVSGKLAQLSGKSTLGRFEGTLSVCRVYHGDSILEKKLKQNASKELKLRMSWLKNISSILPNSVCQPTQAFSQQCQAELNLDHEFKMLGLFYDAWKSDVIIETPMPLLVIHHEPSIHMSYITWPRLSEILNGNYVDINETQRMLIAGHLRRFFNTSIHKHRLLHGDMSKYNVLVDISSRDSIKLGVVDMGMSTSLSDAQHKALNVLKKQNDPLVQALNQAWDGPLSNFTEAWFAHLKTKINIQSIILNPPTQSPKTNAATPILVMFIRSLILISQCIVELISKVKR